MAEVDEIKNIFFFLKKAFNECEGILEGGQS